MADKIGNIENFYSKISVAVVDITSGTLTIGDKIAIKGSTTDFEMTVVSMQIDRADIESASAGQKIGLKVPERVRPGDEVFKI
ncbi:MAG: translation elongation factor-like protein [Candidatus Heimdallarchaeota archaeon]|nr:MAG: translation elongation factor-like protein [Candidatus Heimdallarchaeota archaeon]